MASINGTLVTPNQQSIPENATVDICLCGYGGQVPRATYNDQLVPGSVGSFVTPEVLGITADADGKFTVSLVGNDVINPQGTYYTFTMRDPNGDIIQINAYQFAENTGYNLDTMDPFDPSASAPPGIPPPVQNLLLIIAYDPAAVFPGDTFTSWEMWLTGDCAPTFINLVDGNLYTVILYQDSVGGHQFFWPSNVFNAVPVDPDPDSTTVQTFVAIDGDLYPIGPGTYYP
jgi:hypothetical protein